jgi:tRNA(Ile)-lysidine synthase
VGVSGGGDSVALLLALHEWSRELGWSLVAAHLNHGARGADSDADARFVADLAASLGIPCRVGNWSAPRPAHFEEDARRARLSWLGEVASSEGAVAVAVGHTREDQAETILHRIARGTGLQGLAGMPARRPLAPGVDLIRPFLGVAREELRETLRRLGQPWREDATNFDRANTRARIRHDVLPLLESAVHPGAGGALVRLGELARRADRLLSRRWEALARRCIAEEREEVVELDRPRLAALGRLDRVEVLRRAWRRRGWPEMGMSRDRWERLASLVRAGKGKVDIGAGVAATATADRLCLVRTHREAPGP